MDVRQVTEFDEFQELEPVWNEFVKSSTENNIFLTFDWFLSWWLYLSEEHSLEIYVFSQDEDICGIAPLMRAEDALNFVASHEVTDYCDCIVVKGKEEECLRILFNHWRSDNSHIEKIELINIKSTSLTLEILLKMAEEYGFSYKLEESEEIPLLQLPVSYEDFIEALSRKNRHELRRKLRRCETLPKIKMQKITESQDLGPAINDFIELHRNYSTDKNRFWEKPGMTDFFREVTARFAAKKWAELNFLYSGSDLVAGLLNFIYDDTVYFYNMAYNPDFAAYNPGYYLCAQSIRDAIAQNKAYVDFLRGSEKYKYDFGARKSKIYNLILRLDN